MNALLRRLNALRALIRKEFLSVLKDPSTRVILFAPAIMQSLLFGYAATYDLNNVPYVLLDRSHSPASADLMARIDASGVFHRMAQVDSPSQMGDAIDRGEALVAIHIGQRFAAQLAAGEAAPVQVIADGRNSTSAGAAIAYLGAIAAAASGPAGAPRIRVESRAWFNPNLETRWNVVPALIAALSMLQTLLLTALSVAREREQGTFDQLLVTPLCALDIMVGKAVPPVLIGLAQSTLILCVARFWFGIPMAGSVLTLYAGLVIFTTASVGIGLSISALSVSMQQAMLYTFVLVMPLMLLSGLTTPVRNMPQWLQWATQVNPLRFAIDLVQRVYLEGVGLATVAQDLYPMLIIGALTLPLAAWLFRNRLV